MADFDYVVIGLGVTPTPGTNPPADLLTPDKVFYKPGAVVLDADVEHIINSPLRTKIRRVPASSHPSSPRVAASDAPAVAQPPLPPAPAASPALEIKPSPTASAAPPPIVAAPAPPPAPGK